MTAKRGLFLLGTIIAWLATAFMLLTFIIGMVQVFHGDGSTGSNIAGAVIVAVVMILLGWLGLVCEHRFRGTPAAATAPAAPAGTQAELAATLEAVLKERQAAETTTGAPGATSASPETSADAEPTPATGHTSHASGQHASRAASGRRRANAHEHRHGVRHQRAARVAHHRHKHPIGAAFGATISVLFFIAFFAWSPIVTVANFVHWERSRATQHGVYTQAVVLRVDNTQHCGRSGCSWTTAIPARLVKPVDGQQTTTIHAKGESYAQPGQTGDVMVDRSDPGYAEFPGQQLVTVADWVVMLAIWILIWGLPVWIIRRSRSKHRKPHRRRTAAAT